MRGGQYFGYSSYSYNFHTWKIANLRPFMQFSVLMDLHENCIISIFFIYPNCMITNYIEYIFRKMLLSIENVAVKNEFLKIKVGGQLTRSFSNPSKLSQTYPNKVAVVSLPPQSHHNRTSTPSSSPSSSANSTVDVKNVIATGVDWLFSLVWTPSGDALQGYLCVRDGKNKKTLVYKVDLETDLKNLEASNETQLREVHGIFPREQNHSDNKITPLCATDDSTIFALSGDFSWSTSITQGQPVLIKLGFPST